jgi:hypothetical protein
MRKVISVKKSVSMPSQLWKFVHKHSKQAGHGMASRTVQQAIELLRMREEAKSK